MEGDVKTAKEGNAMSAPLRAVRSICGGLASWVWFCEWLSASAIYGLLGALVMAALSVSSPRPGVKQLMVKD
jgi:hypothetical protein